MFYLLLCIVGVKSSWGNTGTIFHALRILGIIIILWLTGFIGRIEPSYVASDASATNRLVLWSGGLQMMAAAPLSGWGTGNSGDAFMQWYQPVEADAKYTGMVNSFLHVGVERGLVFLGVVLFSALLIMGLGMIASHRYARSEAPRCAIICAACVSVGVGFLVCNFFSTLWIVRGLWWGPLIATITIFALFFFRPLQDAIVKLGFAMLAAVIGASATILMLYIIGNSLDCDIKVDKLEDSVVLSNITSESVPAQTFVVFPDQEVLGDDYGKELRRLLTAIKPAPWTMVIATGKELPDQDYDVCLIFGRGIELHEQILTAVYGQVFFIHPTTRPDNIELVSGMVTVVLPEFDFFGQGTSWKHLADENHWQILVSEGAGLDIRLAWPDVILPSLTDAQR